jgi:hypothetical protein
MFPYLCGAVLHANLPYFARWSGAVFEYDLARHGVALYAQDLARREDGDKFVGVEDFALKAGENGGAAENGGCVLRVYGSRVGTRQGHHVRFKDGRRVIMSKRVK